MKSIFKFVGIGLTAVVFLSATSRSNAENARAIVFAFKESNEKIISVPNKAKLKFASKEEAEKYISDFQKRVSYPDFSKVKEIRSEENPAETVTVTLKYEGSQRSQRFGLYNADATVSMMKMGRDGEAQLEIPQGVYDMYCVANNDCVIVHENISVTEDGTFLFSESELTETIEPYALLRNGERMSVPICKRLDHEPWMWWDYSDGANADFYNFMYYLAKEGMPPVKNGICYADSYPEGGEKLLTKFRTNKLSDKFHLTSTWFVYTTDGEIEISSCDYTGLSSGEYPSYNKGFVKYEVPSFAETPLRLTEGIAGKNISVNARMWMNDNKIGGGGLYIKNPKPNVYVAQGPVVNDAFDLKTVILSEGVQLDKEMTYDYDLGGGETMEFSQKETRCISSLPAVYVNGRWEYVNQNHEECMDWSYQDAGDGEVPPLYPGLPAYSFDASQLTEPLGNSAPILVLLPRGYRLKSDETHSKWLYVWPQAYIGRFGEVRMCDFWMMNAKMKRDGEVIYDTDCYYNLDNWTYRNLSDGHEKGIFEAEYTNTNVLVDGEIQGYNKTYIIIDERNEDLCMPNMQMLIFKDTDGNITDRFASPSEGIMEFSAGDFNWETDQAYYTCAEPIVKVEYSPYQKEDYDGIEVEEVPENYYMPGFGHFYRGSLKDLDRPSDNGWYDLRFTLTDAAGNKMVQTLSPAFFVEGQSVLSEIDSDRLRMEIEGNVIVIKGKDIAEINLYAVDGKLVGSAKGSRLALNTWKGVGIVKIIAVDGSMETFKVMTE